MRRYSPGMRTNPELYPLLRLAVNLALMTIGSCGMYVVVVVLPTVQAEFGATRAGASLPYTLTMIGFGIGGVLMGRLTDRFGVMVPTVIGAFALSAGFLLASQTSSMWTFALVQGSLIGLLGCAASYAPLVTDTSLWFTRRRGIAVAICASGNYMAGAIWPSIIQHYVETIGWRETFQGVGIFCLVTMLPLSLVLRRKPPAFVAAPPRPGATVIARDPMRPFGLSPNTAQALICVAGVACCVAMSMPQVHIVAYCGDLGFGAARGAQMLSLMLACGVVSRLVFGLVSDRIGGLRTLLIGSVLQGIALLLFLPFDSLGSLFVVAGLFGLFQGGIVPAYAIIVREHFAPAQAGTRVGIALTATMLGMALGGWLSGRIFDITGSYSAAFINGIAWNLVNVVIVLWLFQRSRRTPAPTSLNSPPVRQAA